MDHHHSVIGLFFHPFDSNGSRATYEWVLSNSRAKFLKRYITNPLTAHYNKFSIIRIKNLLCYHRFLKLAQSSC